MCQMVWFVFVKFMHAYECLSLFYAIAFAIFDLMSEKMALSEIIQNGTKKNCVMSIKIMWI